MVYISLFICIIIFCIQFNILSLVLIWNLFLAMIPYAISCWLVKNNQSKLRLPALLIWLIFLPNCFYMITDFIHIAGFNIEPYSSIDSVDFIAYLMILEMFCCAMTGIKLGKESINKVISVFNIKKYKLIFLILLSLMSSIGIYIGRFLRFNSWNIFQIKNIFIQLLNQDHQQMLLFVFLYFIFIVSYISFNQLFHFKQSFMIK